jgi:hypothetical protein
MQSRLHPHINNSQHHPASFSVFGGWFSRALSAKYWGHFYFILTYNHPTVISLIWLLYQQCVWPSGISKFCFIHELLCTVIATMTICTELWNTHSPVLHHNASAHQTEHGDTSRCVWKRTVFTQTHGMYSNFCQMVMWNGPRWLLSHSVCLNLVEVSHASGCLSLSLTHFQ